MTPPRPRPTPPSPARANARVAVALVGLVGAMGGLAYASVPFYDWFCRATGYGGTPGVATVAPDRIIDRVFEVRFDANVAQGLPWDFRPEVPSVRVRAGEVATVVYRIESRAETETRGIAAFNVTPEQAGGHFAKIACFCFTEQTLRPHEAIEAPVTFYVDPAADADKNLRGRDTITLSYTFFPADGAKARAASAALVPASGSRTN